MSEDNGPNSDDYVETLELPKDDQSYNKRKKPFSINTPIGRTTESVGTVPHGSVKELLETGKVKKPSFSPHTLRNFNKLDECSFGIIQIGEILSLRLGAVATGDPQKEVSITYKNTSGNNVLLNSSGSPFITDPFYVHWVSSGISNSAGTEHYTASIIVIGASAGIATFTLRVNNEKDSVITFYVAPAQ